VPYNSLTPAQIVLVRQSFDSLKRREFADIFYRRFFELAPETRRLFPHDLEAQYFTLMNMMAAIIGALDSQNLFQSITTYAGLRHARFGAKPAHFSAFGTALIWSLEHQLGVSFTSELRAAWQALYHEVQNKMMSAAERAAEYPNVSIGIWHDVDAPTK
jgi:hemoglobin-like flavoprotein